MEHQVKTNPGEMGMDDCAGRLAGLQRRARACRMWRVAVLACSVAMASCGGGGGDGSPSSPPPPPPPGPPPVVPAIRSVPVPVGYDANRLAAFNRINEARAAAGLGLLEQAVLLDSAAQAHADWQGLNGVCGHFEVAGTPGFIGVYPIDRINFVGYHSSGGGGEDVDFQTDSVEAIDELLRVFYHREFLLMPDYVDVGIGRSRYIGTACNVPLVVELDTPSDPATLSWGQAMRTEAAPLSVWPLDGATDVATHMGGEIPNPVPEISVYLLGMPATLVADYWKRIEVSRLEMVEFGSGVTVDAVIRSADNDPNGLVFSNYVGIIPRNALKPITTYTVTFEGKVGGLPVKRVWTFTTGY